MRNRIADLFSSVMVRLLLIFGALAATTVAAIMTGWFVFQSIAMNMTVLTNERLPELRDSAAVVSVTDELRSVLADILIANDAEAIETLQERTSVVLAELRAAVSPFPAEKTRTLNEGIADAEAALTTLINARSEEFTSSQNVADAVESALALSNEAAALLAVSSDDAFFELVIGGEETITSIDDTLSKLIEVDFLLFQATLGARAEVNLLSGVALSMLQTRDPSLLSVLQDLGNASGERLAQFASQMNEAGADETLIQNLANAGEFFTQSIRNRGLGISASDTLSQRQSADTALSSALDDIYFDFVISSEEAKTGNAAAIQALMDEQVAQIRLQASVDAATKSFFVAAMQTALARDGYELKIRGETLRASGLKLLSEKENVGPEISRLLDKILQIADPGTGIASMRAAAFDAQSKAFTATNRATEAVRNISRAAVEFAGNSQTQIENVAGQLSMEVQNAREQMKQIGFAGFLIVLAAPVAVWLMVTKPLQGVTRVTERLADGDMSTIENSYGKRGEIGRLAVALRVFRDGAIERQRLQEDEKLREAKERAEKLKAEQAKKQAEEAEKQAQQLREKQERDRELREREKEDALRHAAERERQERAKEQQVVVSELAAGLGKLSKGDLTHRISTQFPGDYEALRRDFNQAAVNLSDLMQKVRESAASIDGNSAEIASSSLDLSRRTETSAATLEETAAALNQLTSSVSSAAQGASDASNTVEVVRKDAEKSKTVMANAVTAMSEIEESSNEITKIVEVIDSIAFQTNLLALNAGVEAARAGEAGRGFAVVASEVRSLAHRCSEAALQINNLISKSGGHVQNGVSLLDETDQALAKILEGITVVSNIVSEIAVSSGEQSSGISEINSAVEQLDQTTQQNAAMFEETTAASQALTEEAGTLARVISAFRTGQTEAPGNISAQDKAAAHHAA